MADAVPERPKEVAEKKEKKERKEKKEKKPQQPKQQKVNAKGNADTKGITVKREDDLAEWYAQVLNKGKFVSYYDVQGCYILEPPIYFIWEEIKTYFDKKIKAIGVRNCSYPLFISKENLEKEASHVEGFSAEVAWVRQLIFTSNLQILIEILGYSWW